MKKLSIILFLAISLCACLTAGAQVRTNYETILEEIDRSIAREEWDSAEIKINEALMADPSNPTNALLLSNLGMIRFYSGYDSIALDALDKAHRMAPRSVTVLANRARILAALGQNQKALDDYNTIEKIDSAYADTYLYRGLLYLYSGNFEKADTDFRKLNLLHPDDEETLIATASYYTITDRYDDAFIYYDRLVRQSPAAEYYAGRAMCHLFADRLSEAADDISSGLELDPDYGELYLCRAILNKRRYETGDSLRDAKRAIDLGVNPHRVKTLLSL